MRNRMSNLRTMTIAELESLISSANAELKTRSRDDELNNEEAFLNSGVLMFITFAFPTNPKVLDAHKHHEWMSEYQSQEQLDRVAAAIESVVTEKWNDGDLTLLKLKNGGLLKWDPKMRHTYVLSRGVMP